MTSLLAPAAILLYHRVAAPGRDVHRLCVTPERFTAHMDHLRRHEHVVTLSDIRRPARRRRVAVTFDDGYADNALVARPILEDHAVPATFFVTVGLLGSPGPRWWDELEQLFFDGHPRRRHVRLEIAGQALVVDAGSDAARHRAHDAVYRRLRPLRSGQIDDVLQQLRAQIDADVRPRPDQRFMTHDELRDVAQSEFIDVGGHALTHQPLSTLTPAEQRTEIVDVRSTLSALTGGAVQHFAYPFGARETFDETSERLVADAGYRTACAGWPGVVRPRTPAYRLPRIVVGDWTVDELAGRLARFL